MKAFGNKPGFLSVLIFLLFAGIAKGQSATDTAAVAENTAEYETGTIRAVKPRISPFFSASYKYKVIESPIKDPGALRAIFLKASKDTLNKKKLVLANPEKTSLSQDLSERVKYQFCRADTPYLDSMKISFRVNKQGKIISVDLDALGPLRDSMKIPGWKPVRAHDIIELELYRLFGVYQAKDEEVSSANANPNLANPKPYSFRAGGYKTKSQVRNASTASDNASIPVYRQSFNCEATVIVSTAPQTAAQKATGIRFVIHDDKSEPEPVSPLKKDSEVPIAR